MSQRLFMDSTAAWLEVSLVVDGEMAEAVAEALARFVPGGVVIESTDIADELEGEGSPSGPLRVCGYLPVDAGLENNRQRLEEALWHLGRIRPLPAARYTPIAETSWMEAWKKHYRPIAVGKRLLILPAWLPAPDANRVVVRIDPGMAFGTGTHPTTKLCLEILEELLDAQVSMEGMYNHPEDLSVIDVGCGSGILAIASVKLGASQVLGVDTDTQSIEAVRHNAALNGVSDGLEFGVGSVAEVRAGKFSLRQAQLVIANILASTLVGLLGEGLGDLLTRDGTLVLSGVLTEQAGEVEAAAQSQGLHLMDRREMEDWVALVFTPQDRGVLHSLMGQFEQ